MSRRPFDSGAELRAQGAGHVRGLGVKSRTLRSMEEQRDLEPASATEPDAHAEPLLTSTRRNVVVAIGIDRYQNWKRLTNAVSDARGALTLFQSLGFKPLVEPLLDSAATGKALQELVMDDLRMLGPEDSLVLFYAGHGGTRVDRVGNQEVKTGYLIPIDASDRAATWIELDSWLRAVARLPAKHILVILDACHSGIALGPIIKWRDTGTWQTVPLSTLNARRSRRIITSALDDQVALDSGPVYGHSLFTGCLLEGLSHGLGRSGQRVTTGSELGLYLQKRVETYPHSRQTPDFGTFDFDDRGELLLPLLNWQDEGTRDANPPLAPALPEHGVAAQANQPATPIGLASPGSSLALKATPTSPTQSARRLRRVVALVGGALALALTLWLTSHKKPSDRPRTRSADLSSEHTSSVPFIRTSLDAGFLTGWYSTGTTSSTCSPEMVYVPDGAFEMGSADGEGLADEHPRHAVTLQAYCIDRTEVTVSMYGACVKAKGCQPPPLTVKLNGGRAEEVKQRSQHCNRDDRADHPINCVDWELAAAYCKWAQKRLPTEAEWEYAARGGDERAYPWGNEPPNATLLNGCGAECVQIATPSLGPIAPAMYNASDGWNTTAPVGSFPAGKSPFGVLDMAGNVREWTADWYGGYPTAAAASPQGPRTGRYRVSRGSGWYHNDAIWVRVAARSRNEPSYRNNGLGFRCARTP